MESIFCPDSRAHVTSWVGAGAGKGAKCPSCVVVQITAPGPVNPPACVYCEEKKNVFNITVCRNCSQMPPDVIATVTKGTPKPPLKTFRTMLNGLGEYFYEHLCTSIDYKPPPPEAVAVETAQDDSQVQKLELLLEQRGKEVEHLTQEIQQLRDQLTRATAKTTPSKPSAKQVPESKSAPEVAPELSQLSALNSLLEKFEKQQAQIQEVSRENGVLSEQVRALSERLADEEANRATAGFQGSVAAPPHVHHTSASSYDTALSLASVMPLLNELQLGDSRLNTKSTESFLSIAELGIREPAKVAHVRKAMKTCVRIARLVGASKAVTFFGQAIRRKLDEDPEQCLSLVHDLKRIYLKVAKEEGSGGLMKEILLKLEGDSTAFDGTVRVIGYLSEVLPPSQLTELTQALFLFLKTPTEETKEWLDALSAIPLQWEQQYREKAVQGIRKLMAAVIKMNFDAACLQLLQILNTYTHADPEPLFIFISRASEALGSEQPPIHVQTLVTKLFIFLQLEVSPEMSKELDHKSFAALRVYFTAEATRETVALIMCILIALEKNTHSALTWLYGDGKAGPVEHSLKLLRLLQESGTELVASAEVADKFFTAFTSVQGLTAAESLVFIKATGHLCEAKPMKAQIIIESLTDMMNNPAAHPFVNEIAQLSDINEAKGHLVETRKLLNTARRFPTDAVLPTARYLANIILQLRKAGTKVPILTRKLKLVLLDKTNNLKQLLASVRPLMKSEDAAPSLVLKMLELLPGQPDEQVHLLSFVGDLANTLAAAPVSLETAIHFCEDAVLPCFATENVNLLVMMHAQLQVGKQTYLSEMLRNVKRKFSTLDIYEQYMLPSLQPETLRIFDCSRLESKTIRLEQPIKVDTSSSYAFVDDGGLVCCGGSDSTGAKNASASRASSVSPIQDCYQLSCIGKVEILPNMRDARNYHGVLYYRSKGLYVFGGSSQPDVRRKF